MSTTASTTSIAVPGSKVAATAEVSTATEVGATSTATGETTPACEGVAT